MPSPVDYPDDHPGWNRLIDGIVRVSARHPEGHCCPTCRQLRAEQGCVLHELAGEIVDTWKYSRHPALRTIVHRLRQAMRRTR